MQLVDWSRLIECFKAPNRRMLHQPVMSSVPAADSVRIAEAPEGDLEFNERVLSPSTNDGQECPRCGGAMTARYARAMNNGIAQSVFLSCLNFPACRGTRPL
ncbi:TPA: topoisomerase DNA-binding C4 zinc finger domain-containing protein [Pseudomonas putida]|nr:topoisomerase DNA-binding C4 zinc finger domain-containing protein [Pseudomonas putida]HDS1705759.1 topoisomerase DNA-binding C4 zinc finger domain-containing protein [Pseudomonas putida]HEJ1056137.1 topoisomerase DNA-binding C4 zinc finger domain-containing protein [Pseudomonas putida]